MLVADSGAAAAPLLLRLGHGAHRLHVLREDEVRLPRLRVQQVQVVPRGRAASRPRTGLVEGA